MARTVREGCIKGKFPFSKPVSVGEAVSNLSQVLAAEVGVYKRWIWCSSCLTFLLVVPDYCLSLEASHLLMGEKLIFFYYFFLWYHVHTTHGTCLCCLLRTVQWLPILIFQPTSWHLRRKQNPEKEKSWMKEVCSPKKMDRWVLFVKTNKVTLCLVCKEMVIVFKAYNWKNITCKNVLPNLMCIKERFVKTE